MLDDHQASFLDGGKVLGQGVSWMMKTPEKKCFFLVVMSDGGEIKKSPGRGLLRTGRGSNPRPPP